MHVNKKKENVLTVQKQTLEWSLLKRLDAFYWHVFVPNWKWTVDGVGWRLVVKQQRCVWQSLKR